MSHPVSSPPQHLHSSSDSSYNNNNNDEDNHSVSTASSYYSSDTIGELASSSASNLIASTTASPSSHTTRSSINSNSLSHSSSDSNSNHCRRSNNRPQPEPRVTMKVYVRAIKGAAEDWAAMKRSILQYEVVVGKLLFQNLFEIDPDAVQLFPFLRSHLPPGPRTDTTNIVQLFESSPFFSFHCRKVIEMLEEVLSAMLGDELGSLGEAFNRLGQKHLAYGVEGNHFQALETALLRTVKSVLTEYSHWSEEAHKGWAAVIKFISKGMQEGASHHYQVEIDRHSRGSLTPSQSIDSILDEEDAIFTDDDGSAKVPPPSPPAAGEEQQQQPRKRVTLVEPTKQQNERERSATLRMRVIRKSEGTSQLLQRRRSAREPRHMSMGEVSLEESSCNSSVGSNGRGRAMRAASMPATMMERQCLRHRSPLFLGGPSPSPTSSRKTNNIPKQEHAAFCRWGSDTTGDHSHHSSSHGNVSGEAPPRLPKSSNSRRWMEASKSFDSNDDDDVISSSSSSSSDSESHGPEEHHHNRHRDTALRCSLTSTGSKPKDMAKPPKLPNRKQDFDSEEVMDKHRIGKKDEPPRKTPRGKSPSRIVQYAEQLKQQDSKLAAAVATRQPAKEQEEEDLDSTHSTRSSTSDNDDTTVSTFGSMTSSLSETPSAVVSAVVAASPVE